MAFYNPISLNIKGIPIIVYLDESLEKVLDRTVDAVQNHIQKLHNKHELQQGIDYQIIILWAEDNDIMTDVWIFTKTNEWGSGPLADVKIFRGHEEVSNIGVGSGNTLIMLGKEEEYRRGSKSLKDYLSGQRPELPDYLILKEDFQK